MNIHQTQLFSHQLIPVSMMAQKKDERLESRFSLLTMLLQDKLISLKLILFRFFAILTPSSGFP